MKLLLFFVLRLFKGEIWVIDNVRILDYYWLKYRILYLNFFLVRLLKENKNRKKIC